MGSNPTLNVLVTSAGGVSGTFLIRYLQHHPIENYHYHIVTVDSNDQSLAKHMSPVFYHVPKSDDPRYEKVIYDIINQERIHIVFPVTSYDIPFYAKHRKKLKDMGINMLVCDFETHEKLHNKTRMYALMTSIGIPVPHVYEKAEDVRFPAMLKACESSGSAGVYKLESDLDLQYWTSKLKEYVITDYVIGREFTVDCLFDESSRWVCSNTRERRKVQSGAVVVTKTVTTPEPIKHILNTLASQLSIVGPVNFQYIQDEQNRVFLTDFNTRFASGGLPLTIYSGCDIPNMMIQLMLGRPVPKVSSIDNVGLTMYRYYDELFIKEDE